MNLRPRRAEPPHVDITPLIDVVFLMLIFFMVSTTFDKQTQLKVDLPEAGTPEVAEEIEPKKVDITIDAKGNFYVNDKPTGAVVGQQPFGGGRQSGTNDKAGSHLNLLRWTSVRTIKETFIPIHNWEYPHMEQS